MANLITDPVGVVKKFLENTTNPDVIRTVVAPDATYVSLNYEDTDLQKIMMWCGTKKGIDAFIENFDNVWQCWEAINFEPQDVFGSGERVAVFGRFTYRSYTLNKLVTTPFSIFAKVKDGMIYYFQFMEDTFATAASFRIGGAGTFHSNPKDQPFKI